MLWTIGGWGGATIFELVVWCGHRWLLCRRWLASREWMEMTPTNETLYTAYHTWAVRSLSTLDVAVFGLRDPTLRFDEAAGAYVYRVTRIPIEPRQPVAATL